MADGRTPPLTRAIAGIDQPWPLVMGIVNVTNDSFHDGGRYTDTEAAIAHGRRLADEGAVILDVGGESTRPGAEPVTEDEELRRVLPVVEALAADGHVVSIDTRKAAVMALAVEAGARMINDTTALRYDSAAMSIAASLDVPIVLMHSRGEPANMQTMTQYEDLVGDVAEELTARIEACKGAGIKRERLIVDPGIGFAKTARQCAELLRHMAVLHDLGCPLLIGASRKSFIGALAGTERTDDRLPGSIAAALWAAQQGAAIVRVHDVAETVQALAIFRALCYKDAQRTEAE